MSAREKLLDYVDASLVDAFAHELAEKIRYEARQYGWEDGEAMKLAADLIDPEEEKA